MIALARILVILLLPFFLLLSAARIVMTHTYIQWEYGRASFPSATRISDAERLPNALVSLDFVTGSATQAAFRALRVNGAPAWNEREVDHMIDVRVVIQNIFTFYAVASVVLIAALLALRGRRAARALQLGSLFTVILLVALGVFAATSFNQFFTMFHGLFFTGDTWIFDYEDTLIQLFPLPFWYDAALLIVGLTIGLALLIAVAAAWALRGAPARSRAYRPRRV